MRERAVDSRRLRGLHSPVRNLSQALDDIYENLYFELDNIGPGSPRRAEITERLSLLRWVADTRLGRP